MHRKILFVFLIFALLSFQSCDQILGILGMPKKSEIKEIEKQAYQDSIAKVMYNASEEEARERAESTGDFDAISEETNATPTGYGNIYTGNTNANSTGNTVNPVSTGTTGAVGASPTGANRYHIVVGSFQDPKNVAKMVKNLSDKGFRPVEIRLRNGLIAVSAGSYAHFSEAENTMRRMQSEFPALCPHDAQILDTKK